MKLLLKVDASNAKVVCKECREKHLKCNRGIPKCANCMASGLACNRDNARESLVRSKVPGLGVIIRTTNVIPTTWMQALNTQKGGWYIQYFNRRCLMPFELALPKPTEGSEIERLRLRALQLASQPQIEPASSQTEFPMDSIVTLLQKAKEMFFLSFNPFCPLFSEEGFLSKPRSMTLVKIVLQIGLERMEQDDFTKAAILENNLTITDLKNLPTCLDTLQCHLLLYFGITTPSLRKGTVDLSRFMKRYFSLMGFFIPSRCLERILAVQMFHYTSFHVSVGQILIEARFNWFEASSDHLKRNLLKHRPSFLNRPSDFIHYITSQSTYHSYTTVVSAYKTYERALQGKTPSNVYRTILHNHLDHLKKNFLWGWTHLTNLAPPKGYMLLLNKSRLMLTLRYHADYILVAKLGLHILVNPLDPISKVPRIREITDFSRLGLNMAIRNINLASTIMSPYSDAEFFRIRTILTSVAFIMAHCKVVKSEYGQADPLYKAICQAAKCLKRAQANPSSRSSALFYLKLLSILANQNNLSFDL
ncbi:hypothetical protein DSO57_1007422 [Entomophthora muscae]|uniref:Uncharacterized protein n=1 Tax=Entomophthora muscae TaxID=34485 RepID=A0ACC2T7Q7_9FUNG|nr:hypothetical protein DSO57_1007422 [Entomophthora muscae]